MIRFFKKTSGKCHDFLKEMDASHRGFVREHLRAINIVSIMFRNAFCDTVKRNGAVIISIGFLTAPFPVSVIPHPILSDQIHFFHTVIIFLFFSRSVLHFVLLSGYAIRSCLSLLPIYPAMFLSFFFRRLQFCHILSNDV